MTDNLKKALVAMTDAANEIRQEICAMEKETEWKKDLPMMMAENRADTMEVFAKFTGKRNKTEEEKEFCKTRCLASLQNFFEEPWEAKCLDDALEHLQAFIEISRR